MSKGVLLIVSGPSGAGKGTVCSEYIKRRPETFLSVSATSRSPRPGDEDGVTYFFKTRHIYIKRKKKTVNLAVMEDIFQKL